MMTTKNILQLLIISVFLISCSQTVNYDEEKEYFEEKKSILYYKGSPYSGVIEKHYKNGELHEKITFKEGKKDGDFESYYENGQLKDKGSYKDGEPHGNYEVYYENGQLRKKASYQEGEKDGISEEYHENGQLMVKGSYKEGEEDGGWESYYENGKLERKESWEDGIRDGDFIRYYENGQLEYKASYQEGKKDGNFESYYENGQLEYKETWKGGIKDGDFEEYYDNGQLKSKISFKNGKEIVSKLYAEFKTSKGDFVTELYYHKAPMTVGNFVALAEGNHPEVDEQYQNKKIYNNIIFHRVIDGFMIQAGDPSGTGQGGPGYKFEDEFHPDLKHEKGALSMVNAGPNTNASQFFITLVPTPHLDQKHSVFGQVVEGEQVLKSIEKVETAVMEKPVEDVVIETINIIRKGSEAKSFDAVEAFKQGRVLAAKAKEEAKAEKAKLLEEVSEGFEETESGLRYKITEENPSGKSPKTGNTVKVHYTGYLLDGTKFDSSLDRDQPIEFAVGTGRVIPGWDEGIMLLKTGEKAKLVIPSELAYGARQTGPIPPNSVLKFEVELLEVVK